jgi:hypothetical protein
MNYEIIIGDKNVSGALRNTLNNNRIPVIQVVAEAEQWLYERLRVREMLTSTTGTMTASATAVGLPARYRQAKDFIFTGTRAGRCRLKSPETVRQAWTWNANGVRSSGMPSMYYADASSLIFDRMADQAYTYDFMHYQALAPLTSTNSENVLTGRALRATMLACRAFACEWTKEGSMDRYLQLAQLEIDKINEQGEMEQGGLDEAVVAE